MKRFHPTGDKILVKRDPEGDSGGRALVEGAKKPPVTGVVVGIGPGGPRVSAGDNGAIAQAVSPGDRILFPKFAGTDVEISGVRLVILREEDVLGMIAEFSEDDDEGDA